VGRLRHADEAFLLNIPLRFDASQETGEVRITLHLAGATVAGDSVTFTTGSGNSVRIVYQPLTNFARDFCQGAAAAEKNIQMLFVGPDVTKYNITSFVVGAPAVECSKPSKRTADLPATLVPNDDGVAPALDAELGGRHALDVILVLDKSGSMNELPPDAETGSTKAEILGAAASAWSSSATSPARSRSPAAIRPPCSSSAAAPTARASPTTGTRSSRPSTR
jgi:hypothetical protein